MPSQILLKGGMLLVRDESKRVVCQQSDLLIQDDRIYEIGYDIQPSEGARVIDCTGTLVSPGFVDTHRHQWQSQQKGLHADQVLLDYYYSGNLGSSHYTPEDMFWGVLSSSLEAIDIGTTTVVDHARVNYSSDHSDSCSRQRGYSWNNCFWYSLYLCYCAYPRVETWEPELKIGKNPVAKGVIDTFRELAAMQLFGPRGRVRLGFAMDTIFKQPQLLKDIFAQVRELGAYLITSHITRVNSSSICSSSIPGQMETALQVTRIRRLEGQMRDRKWDGTIGPSVEEALNLRTILGAQAIGLSDKIGSLTVGKKADIVIFNSNTPAMVAAADCNPVAAILLHSSVRDIETVIVDGVIRKENSSLNRFSIPQDIKQKEETDVSASKPRGWDVRKELQKSRQRLKEVWDNIDEDTARNGLIRSFSQNLTLGSDK
ncbi:hypothetical protein BKA56DRAFT_650366 [Ilyonectria sp. MPI-CAGE-AT-0026]|nr:hypothetical protein BKA56DRAFT_650366 [Ilyonectria sp. MPI-CAGE-AT-0026]